MEQCKLCGTENVATPLLGRDAYGVKCPRCGEYSISVTLMGSELRVPPYMLSAATRRAWTNGTRLEISTTNQEELVSLVRRPQDPLDAIDQIVQHYYGSMTADNQRFVINEDMDYPMFVAQSPDEFDFWLNKTAELGLIESYGTGGYEVVFNPTLLGWQRARELKNEIPNRNQAFVAMSFSDTLDPIYMLGMKPALEDAGYAPMMLKSLQHNDNINDKIIAEIRRSALVVVDFTEQKGGCYFEAGFALGLNIPVIWCCNLSEKDKLHFDTRQYNHIFYSDAAELKTKVYDRIRATAPIKPQ